MEFDPQSISTRYVEIDGIPLILANILSLETRKLAIRRHLYPDSSDDKESKFNFLDLPIEIQILIVREYVLCWPLVGHTPDLIKALRPESEIYQQALFIFYSSRTVSISANNEHRILAMPRALQKRAVSVDLWYGTKLRKNSFSFEFNIPTRLLSAFQYANIRTLTLLSTFGDDILELTTKQLLLLVREAIIKLPSLRKLILEVPVSIWHCVYHGQQVETTDLEGLLKAINGATGVLHQWVEAQSEHHVAVSWESEGTQNLAWTDSTYWRNIKWGVALGFFPAKIYLGYSFHILFFGEENGLHFLGLNPRRLLHSCRDRSCKCSRFCLTRVTILDPKPGLRLRPLNESILEEKLPETVDYRIPAQLLRYRRVPITPRPQRLVARYISELTHLLD
ncbi:hypothetical protein N431DRAFT_157921 [Stipitochalara longipes BDJ]|nr:hypothetical protein N431DRAFT_157921 [Stipitochalara longipes BDJ]